MVFVGFLKKFPLFLVVAGYLAACGGHSSRGPANFRQGALLKQNLLNEYKEIDGQKERAFLDYLAKRLEAALRTGRPNSDSQFTFALLRAGQPFAVWAGSGWIAVSSALVRRLSNEAELAFVLAHEIGHEELGHTPADDSEKAYDQELAADTFGLGLMALAGYDPRAAQDALMHSHMAGHFGQSGPYPSLSERAVNLQNELQRVHWNGLGTVDRRDYQKFRRGF
jgi:predicted Zn-dependent protease